MKHFSFLIIIFSLIFFKNIKGESDPGDEIGKTYFSTHQLYQSVSPEKDSFFRDSFIYRDENLVNKFEITAFASRSFDSRALARYFLPNGKSSILVAGDNAQNASIRDVNAFHLNIDDKQFESHVTFSPCQTTAGIGFHYRMWFSRSSDRGFWFDTSFPVIFVSHNMGVSEHIINHGDLNGTEVSNALEAFSQRAWSFGRIPRGSNFAFGIADIELKVGWQAAHSDICHLETYIGCLVPTGTRPKGCLVFEPVIGNNHHWAFISGTMLAIKGWEKGEHSLTAVFEFNRRYVFEGNEIRTFDLIGKPWGRYMKVYPNKNAAIAASVQSENEFSNQEPGINFFTRCASVKPGFATTVNSAYLYIYRNFHAEFGYNFYGRQKEEIVSINDWAEVENAPALVSARQSGFTTKSRTINQNFSSDQFDKSYKQYASLFITDLDLNSASHPAVIAHTFYLTASYSKEEQEYPLFFAAGASYEFSSNNATLRRLAAWGKIAMAY